MPFNIGLSGVNAAHADLKTTGNNIANTATIGFKASRAEFANIYSTSRIGTARTAIGSGARVAAISQQFFQGNLSFTENNLDIAINGDGFFNVREPSGASVYTRNGQFKVNSEGYIVTNEGAKLQGYQPVTNPVPDPDPISANIDTANIDDLQITTGAIEPRATDKTTIVANLDSQETAIVAGTTINPDDTDSFNHTTSYRTYDSLGNPMSSSIYFQKNNDINNEWTIGIRTVDAAGNAIPTDTAGPPVVKNTQNFLVTFNTLGTIETIDPEGGAIGTGATFNRTAGTGTAELALDLTGAGVRVVAPADDTIYHPTGAAAQTIDINVTSLTQYGASFGINDVTQNGYSSGELAGIDVDPSGIVQARFTNGKSKELGQIVLNGIPNPQGLGQIGNNTWAPTFAAGDAVVNVPGTGGLGLIQSGALEEANVNLTEELISLITAQRNFQANAKTITTADTIAQTIINI